MPRSISRACIALLLVVAAVASAQTNTRRAPRNDRAATPPARSNRPDPADAAPDSGPPRPEGFKPISLATARKETERLRATIKRLEERVASGKSAAEAGAEPTAEKETSEGKRNPDAAAAAPAAKKPTTLAAAERENKTLRRQVDKLLIEVAKLDGTIPARKEGLPPYDPHVIDSPTNAEFCPGKTMEQLEATMRFVGVPVGELEDEVCYEWTIYLTNATRSKHVGHRVWAIMKDGTSAQVREAAPGIVKDGPPPKPQ